MSEILCNLTECLNNKPAKNFKLDNGNIYNGGICLKTALMFSSINGKTALRCRDYKNALSDKFVVRLYDGFDNVWMDISKPVSKEEADKIFADETDNGTKNTKYDNIDYYAIFPADTKMLYSSDRL
jgi:hypothetical protein